MNIGELDEGGSFLSMGGDEPATASRRFTYADVLLKDDDLRRWYYNLRRGSAITADVYLRRLGSVCNITKVSPKSLVQQSRLDQRWSYNFLVDMVTELESRKKTGSYI